MLNEKSTIACRVLDYLRKEFFIDTVITVYSRLHVPLAYLSRPFQRAGHGRRAGPVCRLDPPGPVHPSHHVALSDPRTPIT